ncbi:hypothetical protein H0H81_006832 [Sphagnurus paluster]|uniref:Uncharacterized protein n=1 Tax=Sphagnurus paluster TaxID=117069 RepID=A0A9P7GNV4_9AGAR|nr:hypothetical protein H0H81_006832 [Sphagnurus paluster]
MSDSAVGTVLSMLAEDAQSLKTLSLGGSLSTPSLAYVLQLKNLQSLELRSMGDSIDSHFFKMVADLEKLVDLTIDLYNSPSSTFPAGQGFKRLKKLHITAFFSVIEDILLDLSDEVELESLGFFAPPAPLPMGWETQCTSLFSTVHQRWPQSMRRICIDREWSNLICLPMSLSLIAPLLRIPNIEYFSVREFFLPISNEELGELASSWPSLQELHLPFDDNVAPQISFSMLYTLAALCPRLVHLEMPIDFKEIPPLPNPRPKPVALERLYIANDNPPNETSELLLIARHFDRLFPRLQKLGRLQLKDLEIATWDKVLAMIHAFRSVRLES